MNYYEKVLTPEEQLARRQSAPRQTAEGAVRELLTTRQPAIGYIPEHSGGIDREAVLKARTTMSKYKEGKTNLEERIVENEQWYKLRHWEQMRRKNAENANQVEPVSAWLFNSIANKHADAMDNFPSPNVLPREEGDKGEAETLSSILPVILDQNDFEETYDNYWDYKLKSGTGVLGVFWDKDKMNGLGDISIKKIDLLNLFWEPGITNIQDSKNLFYADLWDNDTLLETYPEALKGRLGGEDATLAKYIYDDNVDVSNKSLVIDWYYKKRVGGKDILHLCKFVNDVVLFSTENEESFATKGLYDHGQYPFVFDTLFSVEGSPCGFGYIDVAKSVQEYIDRGKQAVMQNMLANAKPRHFVRTDGSVNEKEYADLSKDFIHVDGNLGQDSIIPVQGKPLNDIYVTLLTNNVEELKEVTGNRDVSTGGTSGVTAAAGIAAMQEAGSKLSRDNIKASYRAFKKVCTMVIELIRQFYTIPRCFRITGQDGAERFVQYSNVGIRPMHMGTAFGRDMGYRLPMFDLEISAQKASPYSKVAQNEMALSFYNAGFFNPQLADQALACLEMMDFDRKQFVMKRISENGTMYQRMLMMQQQMLSMAQVIDQLKGTNMAEQIAAGIMGGQPVSGGSAQAAEKTEALGGEESTESAVTKKARQRVAESTSPT